MESREVFAAVLRRWFSQNSWPQSITESWAKSCGSPGPWASQISPAFHANLDPKSIFFISLGNFNNAVAERNVLSVTNERVRNLLLKGQPLCHADGVPFDGADFFKLFNGFIDAPEGYAEKPGQLTEQDVSEWSLKVREAFRQLCLKHMVDRSEGWVMLRDRIMDIEREAGGNPNESADCLEWMQEVISGLREPTVEEAIRQAKRWQTTQPFQRAIEELLNQKKLTSTV